MVIKIIPYSNEHNAIFKQLNLEWLDHYNLTESHDLMVLDDPEGTIINRGGYIWLAEADGKIVGSAALMKELECGKTKVLERLSWEFNPRPVSA